MRKPTDNDRITSQFGWRKLSGKLDFHSGIDYGGITAGISGDNIYAIANGTVKRVNNDTDGYGWYVVIEHTEHCTLYAHLNDVLVKEGDVVSEGHVIGHMGSTGNSTATHCHHEVRKCTYQYFWDRWSNGEPIHCIDPELFYLKYLKPDAPHRS